MSEENRNIILAIALSIVILLGYEMFFPTFTKQPAPQAPQTEQGMTGDSMTPVPSTANPSTGNTGTPNAVTVGNGPTATTRDAILSAEYRQGIRLPIETPSLRGSLSLRGARVDDLILHRYRETLDADSADVTLLNPRGTDQAYYAEFGWVGSAGNTTQLPNADTMWQTKHTKLTPETPVTLTHRNGDGVLFEKTISVDEQYMFTITNRVINDTADTLALHAYGLVTRRQTPDVSGFYILHEGPLGVLNEALTEIDYDDLRDDKIIAQSSVGGWVGITDKYWLTAIMTDQTTSIATRFVYDNKSGADRYQGDILTPQLTVSPRTNAETTIHFFAGAKQVSMLEGYQEQLGVQRFDLAIDWGWFHFLTRPIFSALVWLNNLVHNFGVSILLLTVGIKLAFFPLANKSYVSMSKMRKLQPETLKLRERYGDDKMKLNQEMMALYKREKVNPASGCLPILIQIPVFFSLYKVLFVTIEMRHAPFYGWIKDLSAPDPTSMFNLFGLIPWDPPGFLMIGIWPILMGLSMYLQQKINPQPTDPIQAKIFLYMPLFFTFLLAQFPAGLVIYWTWNNALSILQQWVIMRRLGVK